MRFRFVVDVEVERVSGKFAPKEEVGDQILEALESADYGSWGGVGADGDSEYETLDWTATEVTS